MQAVLVKNGQGAADDLYIGEAPKPSPRFGEVLVKVHGSLVVSEVTVYV